MNRALFQKLFPEEYLNRFLATNSREDGRELNQSRKIVIQKGIKRFLYFE